jgi:hypothetical protein
MSANVELNEARQHALQQVARRKRVPVRRLLDERLMSSLNGPRTRSCWRVLHGPLEQQACARRIQ